MRPIGGELALFDDLNYFFTDSGRSSLRLFCRNFPDKRILLPDFLCEIVVEILDQENMQYEFYHINKDLTISSFPIKKDFDVFYIINYFGMHLSIPTEFENKIIIEDNVFFVDFKNQHQYKNWFAFNSYRKVTNIADGSLIKTTLTLDDYRTKGPSPFSTLKYEAKETKHRFLAHQIDDETTYLSKFEDAEACLDNQKEIFHISDKSLGHINTLVISYQEEKALREYNYNYIRHELNEFTITIESDFYSYAIIMSEERDKLRTFLFSKRIFLPIYWPSSKGNNILHKKVLSLPLFYTHEETVYLVKSIKEYYENN